MMQLQIAGAIASKTGVTLYLANGGEMNLPTDSWKTKEILDQVIAPLARGEVVILNLDEFSIEKKIEDKTAGVIRFIKQTMDQLQEMLADLEAGREPSTPSTAPDKFVPLETKGATLAAVVTDTNGKEKVIPNVEKLRKQLDHAAKTENVKGLQNFMQRIASVKAGHTVQELLNFMEKGDLPIANDGCIVAYKVLTTNGKSDGTFVDCHSRKVTQKLGSRVSMTRELVDPSRRDQCSSGLHIARRGYLSSFSGDVITIVKVAPEDVVAVPQREPDKMRAAAYHIVAVLPSEVHSILRSNQPMTSNETAARILADVIAGNHAGITEEVRIGADGGAKITRQTTAEAAKPAPKMGKNGTVKALEEEQKLEKPITPKDLREQAEAAKAEVVETKSERDARKKREKRAAEKAAREATWIPASVPGAKAPKATTPVETKAQRDARKKREKRAAEKAAKGRA